MARQKGQRRYSSLPTDDHLSPVPSPDIEKQGHKLRSSNDHYDYDSPTSGSSSRATSDSYEPMLPARRPKPRRKAPYRYRIPHKTTRYLCLALGSTMIILILSLVRMSYSSARQVETGPVQSRPMARPPQWDEFPFLKRYYGGIRTLLSRSQNVPEYPRLSEDEAAAEASSTPTSSASNPTRREEDFPSSRPFHPYPDYSSAAYLADYEPVSECFLDANATVRIPEVQSYDGIPSGLPDAVMGSYELLGLRDDICFERYGRLGPYGYGYSKKMGGIGAGLHGDRQGIESTWETDAQVNFKGIRWAEVQQRCATANSHRFKPITTGRHHFYQTMAVAGPEDEAEATRDRTVQQRSEKAQEKSAPDPLPTGTVLPSAASSGGKKLLPRTAVIIRTWWDLKYTEESIIYLRSLISELSLLSGGEYTVHFLIHVRDDNMQIWADDDTYQRVLNDALPEEFRGMGTLWSERQMGLVYGGLQESFYRKLPVHGAYRSTFMPMQYFAHQHPEYDYFWQWEMDVRYTGQYYHLFDSVSKWAKEQPRKGLWERNSRFYIPSVHGTWEDFKQMVRVQTEIGTDSANNIWSAMRASDPHSTNQNQPKTDKPIWGPERSEWDDLETKDDPVPPTSYEKDRYTWGVGEEADLISFNPLFDPDSTTWLLAEDVTGYNTTSGLPPRRAAIITASRLSRRLLETMHRETALKRHTMFSEMWPGSVALQHGLKAVYAPHPVYIDRKWPTSYLNAVMNGGRNGAAGGARTSAFGEREHNFRGVTWYYNAGFSPNLWRRWLGFRIDNGGGEEEEVAKEGRMCLPGVLVHPVKTVDLIIENESADEGKREEAEIEKKKKEGQH
ncbi:MAG: hypothetical protein M1819_000028 [Sarea resinae]|nr:MAG: hypothetical protein M1819_000028 [Sarea resinae]